MDGKSFELKVGIFVMIGVILLFIIVFSIGDIYIVKKGYHFDILFNFISGLAQSAPVRVAGVDVGQVESIQLIRSDEDQRSKALVRVWIKENILIEEDARITVNTLGLLGEKYLEVIPGTPGANCITNGKLVVGHDPVSMEAVTENLKEITDSAVVIARRLKDGEGTLGKLMMKDTVYNDLEGLTGSFRTVMERLERGEGTVGKLLTEDQIHKDLAAFVADIKQHPWKLLVKPKEE